MMSSTRFFIISSAGNRGPDGSTTYPIEELTPDLMAFDTSAPKRQMVIARGTRMGEGHQPLQDQREVLRRLRIPGGPVDQMVARADSIDGPWEVTYMVQNESMGVTGVAPARAASQRPRTLDSSRWHVRYPVGRMVVRDHVGPRQRRPHGFLGSSHMGRRLPLIGLPGNLRQGAEHVDQTQHRLQPRAPADVRLERGFQQRPPEPALAVEPRA